MSGDNPAAPADLQIIEPETDAAIRMEPGTRLLVRLSESPTTGYRWTYALEGAHVVEQAADAYESQGTLRGSGGVRLMTFKAVLSGSTAIEFTLRRAWESKPQANSIRVAIEVR